MYLSDECNFVHMVQRNMCFIQTSNQNFSLFSSGDQLNDIKYSSNSELKSSFHKKCSVYCRNTVACERSVLPSNSLLRNED